MFLKNKKNILWRLLGFLSSSLHYHEKISEELKKNLLVLMMSCHLLSSFQGTMFLRDYSLKTKQKQKRLL
jgi:hypothetical protein